ncbi:MAG: GNAT family N-acetyltransferase [Alphaproteobacteria bacterium]
MSEPIIREFVETDREALKNLWEVCGLSTSFNNPDDDMDRAQRFDNARLLVCLIDGIVVGSAFISHDARRGWVYYLAVLPEHQGKGIAKRLLNDGEAWIRRLGLIKMNLVVRGSNAAMKEFYYKLGYELHDGNLLYKWM